MIDLQAVNEELSIKNGEDKDVAVKTPKSDSARVVINVSLPPKKTVPMPRKSNHLNPSTIVLQRRKSEHHSEKMLSVNSFSCSQTNSRSSLDNSSIQSISKKSSKSSAHGSKRSVHSKKSKSSHH